MPRQHVKPSQQVTPSRQACPPQCHPGIGVGDTGGFGVGVAGEGVAGTVSMGPAGGMVINGVVGTDTGLPWVVEDSPLVEPEHPQSVVKTTTRINTGRRNCLPFCTMYIELFFICGGFTLRSDLKFIGEGIQFTTR